ncbi:MAG: 50S ribosomal protein L24 [Candidatus Brockarchaeota archaeon]|nr:50S ribosomal protein L24 [Candidatus Brockarchaeota archaeon]
MKNAGTGKISVHLSGELREKHGRRSLRVRKGDGVAVIRGDFEGVEGTVTRVDSKRGFVFVEGVSRESADGKQVPVPLRASSLVIKKLKLDDEFRKRKVERAVREGGESGK